MGVFLAIIIRFYMIKDKKQLLTFLALLFLVMLPNIVFVLLGEDSAVTSLLKQIVFMVYTLALVIFPISVIRPKLFFVLISPLLPFALLDLFVLKISGTQSTAMHYYTFIATNYNEAIELLAGNISSLIFSILYIITFFILLKKLKWKSVFSRRFKYIIGISSISIISILLLRDIKIAYTFSKENIVEATEYHFYIKLNKTFPFGNISKMKNVYGDIEKLGRFNDKNKDFKYLPILFEDKTKTIVLVIGETARRNNFQIYSYGRKNNPLLIEENNLIAYSNFTTNANYTLTSVAQTLSSVGPNNYSELYNELGLISAFKEAGYKTFWISNQEYSFGSAFNMYSKSADVFVNVSASLDMPNNDLVILPYLKKYLENKEEKKLIVIHSIGSHYRYNLRYPKEFAKYKPELDNTLSVSENGIEYRDKYINSYDNSILLTDYFLSKVISELKDGSEESVMMYLSDHGENLYDDDKELFLHGTAIPSKFELEIPMFIWHSDNYDKLIVEKLINVKEKKLSSEVVFHTLSELGGFKTKLHKEKFDLLSDSLEFGNRTFLLADGSVMSVD